MANITLRLPEELHNTLKEDANKAHRSLHAHLLYLIEVAGEVDRENAVLRRKGGRLTDESAVIATLRTAQAPLTRVEIADTLTVNPNTQGLVLTLKSLVSQGIVTRRKKAQSYYYSLAE